MTRDDAVRVDIANQCVWIGNERKVLSPKAAGVLRLLVERPDGLITKREILDRVWPDTAVTESVLSVAVKQLREALGDSASRPRFIETLHRRGFRWIGPNPTAAESLSRATEHATSSSIPSIVGRDEHLARLSTYFDRALALQPQIVFVTGEAGIGKTALIDAWLAGMAESVAIGRGQCVETFGSGEAYLPLLDAMASLAPRFDGQLAEILRQWAPTWLGQIPSLHTDVDRTTGIDMPAAPSQERMLREWCYAVEALAAQRPLVVVVEDLHWSDPSTLAALELLAQRRAKAPFMIIATYRPVDAILSAHGVAATKHRLTERRLSEEVGVWYLEAEDVAHYLAIRLGDAVDPALAQAMHRQTEGHPLFLVNVLDRLEQAGRVALDGDTWRLRGVTGEAAILPDGLQQAIDHNLTQLGEENMRVLCAASVVGIDFPAAGVAACLERDADEVEDRLDRIAQLGGVLRPAGVTTLAPSGVTGRFALVHALHRQALYERMLGTERAVYHQRYGDWLATQGGTASELAHHYTQAIAIGGAAKAAQYHIASAHHARRLCAWTEAVEHLTQALQLLEREPSIPISPTEVLIALGDTQQQAGTIEVAHESLWRAVTLARQSNDGESLARTALLLGHGYQRLGQLDPALERLCEEAIDAVGDKPSAARARLLAHFAFLLGNRPGTDARREAIGAAALRSLDHVDDAATRAWVLNYLRWSAWRPQDRETLLTELQESRALASRVVDPESRFMLLALIATDGLELGEHAAVDHALEQANELLADAPIPWCAWFAHRITTARALHEGRLADAEKLAHQTFELGQKMDNPNVLPLLGAQTACARIIEGRVDDAAAIVQMAVDSGTPGAAWTCVLAYLRCEQGRRDEASELVERVAVDDFGHIPHDTVFLIGGAALAMTLRALGDRERAAVLYDRLRPHRDRCPGLGSSVFGMGHMTRYLALLSATAGRPDEATKHFEEALVANERLRAEPWLAFTEVDFADHLAGAGDRRATKHARELYGRAHERAVRIGMTGLATRIGSRMRT